MFLLGVALCSAAEASSRASDLVTRPHAAGGDLWGSVGAWFSGRWWNASARGCIREVKRRLKSRTWRSRAFREG